MLNVKILLGNVNEKLFKDSPAAFSHINNSDDGGSQFAPLQHLRMVAELRREV